MFRSRPFGVDGCLFFQSRQPDIDAGQRLGDDIMQFAADLLALFLLRRQKLAGQQPQLFLHNVATAPTTDAIVSLALLEGFLRRTCAG